MPKKNPMGGNVSLPPGSWLWQSPQEACGQSPWGETLRRHKWLVGRTDALWSEQQHSARSYTADPICARRPQSSVEQAALVAGQVAFQAEKRWQLNAPLRLRKLRELSAARYAADISELVANEPGKPVVTSRGFSLLRPFGNTALASRIQHVSRELRLRLTSQWCTLCKHQLHWRTCNLGRQMELLKIRERAAICRRVGWSFVPFVAEAVGTLGGKARHLLQNLIRLYAAHHRCSMAVAGVCPWLSCGGFERGFPSADAGC